MGRGFAWLDTGTPDSLLEAADFVAHARAAAGISDRLPRGDRLRPRIHRPRSAGTPGRGAGKKRLCALHQRPRRVPVLPIIAAGKLDASVSITIRDNKVLPSQPSTFTSDLAVVYLARHAEGKGPVTNFIDSLSVIRLGLHMTAWWSEKASHGGNARSTKS